MDLVNIPVSPKPEHFWDYIGFLWPHYFLHCDMVQSATGGTGAAAFKHAYETLHSQSDLQFSLPKYVPPVPPAWLKELLNFIREHSTAIGWIALAVALPIVALTIIGLGRHYWRRFRAIGREPIENESEGRDMRWRPTPELARHLLAESDSLASQGRFADAVHLLLLRSIDDIDERRPRTVRPALTSREISLLNALPELPRAAFSSIVRLVERARFAGRSVGREDFEFCRREYETFAFAPDWKAGARID